VLGEVSCSEPRSEGGWSESMLACTAVAVFRRFASTHLVCFWKNMGGSYFSFKAKGRLLRSGRAFMEKCRVIFNWESELKLENDCHVDYFSFPKMLTQTT
jgi:hypothetical protein